MYFQAVLLSAYAKTFYVFLKILCLHYHVMPLIFLDNLPFSEISFVCCQYINPCFVLINLSIVYLSISLFLIYLRLYYVKCVLVGNIRCSWVSLLFFIFQSTLTTSIYNWCTYVNYNKIYNNVFYHLWLRRKFQLN